MSRSTLVRGRPVKRDQQEVSPAVTPPKAVGNGAVIDLDDVADEPLVLSDTKRKKTSRRSSAKKQKVSSAAAVKGRNGVCEVRERGEEDDSGVLGDGSDEGAATEEVQPETLDKDDVDCSFIESSRIPTHVAKKDYVHRYPEVCGITDIQRTAIVV